MLRAFRVAIYRYTQPLIEALISAVDMIGICAFHISVFGIEQENVGTGKFGNDIDMVQYTNLDSVQTRIDNVMSIDVYNGTFLPNLISVISGIPQPCRITYQSNRRLIQDFGPHLMHYIRIARDTNVCDEALERTPL